MPFRILIVDDSVAVRAVLHRSFAAQQGWVVCGEAENGSEAIARARETVPDLIVLDLSMPVMNGLEAARVLKRIIPRVLLVMFTSFETACLNREVEAAGVDKVVSKSEPLERLVGCIRSLLPGIA